jgi:hypothetical protein
VARPKFRISLDAFVTDVRVLARELTAASLLAIGDPERGPYR